jgi:three-Cys-motif partner protein
MTKPKERVKLEEVGDWSELKLEILKKYAGAYTKILRANKLHPIYIDGFAGAGEHISKRTQESIAGSPRNALEIEPPFEEFHFVDLNPKRATNLQKLAGDKDNVYVYSGDSRADRQRSMLSATAGWKPPDCYVRVAASKLREERSG